MLNKYGLSVLYTVTMLLFALLSDFITTSANNFVETTYSHLYLKVLVRTFFLISLGLGLGLLVFLDNRKKEGRWKLDKVRFFCVFMPSAIAPIVLNIGYLGGTIFSSLLESVPLSATSIVYQLSCLMAGYYFILSFKKDGSDSR